MGWSSQVVIANLVIIEGPDDGLFMYAGTPALGNLVYSVSNTADTDAEGNAFLSGSVSYNKTSGVFYAVQEGNTGIPGAAAVTSYWTALAAGGPWVLQASLYGNTSGQLILSGRAGILLSKVNLAAYPPWTLTDAPGTPYTTALGPADLTKTWLVAGGDGVAGTIYTLETHVTIETGTTAETFTIGADLNSGTRIPLATLGAAFNGGAASTTYDIPVRIRLIVDAAGTDTPQITLAGPLGDTAANRLATNSANLAGSSVTGSWPKASDNTIAVYGLWGAAGGGPQNAQAYYSEFTRSGP